jgi:hypothetical protein
MPHKDSAPPDPTKVLKQLCIQVAELSARLKELQFSVDAVGTIVDIDLKKDISILPVLVERFKQVESRLDRGQTELGNIESSIGDACARLDILTGKADLLEKRLSVLLDLTDQISERLSTIPKP